MNDLLSIFLTTPDISLTHMSRMARALTALVGSLSRLAFIFFVLIIRYKIMDNAFAQGQGGLLIRKIEGDYHNVVGFPAASFFKFLDMLLEEDADFLSD